MRQDRYGADERANAVKERVTMVEQVEMTRDVVVVGGDAAGLSAALTSAGDDRAKLD